MRNPDREFIMFELIFRKLQSLIERIAFYIKIVELFVLKHHPLRGGIIFLNYANVIKAKSKIVHGGKVKLLHLNKVYPESKNFNLLYLVSSAMPAHYRELLFYVKKSHSKLIWNQNGVAYPAWAGDKYKRINNAMYICQSAADFVIYQSDFCKRASEYWVAADVKKFAILHNPVNLNDFSVSFRQSMKSIRLLIAGTHQDPKRVTLAVEALGLLRYAGYDVHLTIAGKIDWPSGREQIFSLVHNSGLADRVHIFPPFTQLEAIRLYQQNHVLLHLKYNDACPTVPIEALACGLPVIGSRSGGMPELISDSAGILLDVPQDDWNVSHYPKVDDIANAVIQIMDKHSYYAKNARESACEKFSVERWIKKHDELFHNVLSQT